MHDDLLGYALDLLDSADRAAVEVRLESDPAVREELSRLRALVAPLAADRDSGDPPAGLADRTVARLMALRVAPSDVPTGQGRWRRIDAVVAVGILIVLGGLGLSGVARLRHNEGIAACQNNLREYYAALNNYADTRGGDFPHVSDAPPLNRAGAYHTLLHESGALPLQTVKLCPSRPESAIYAYSLGYRTDDGHLRGLRRNDLELLPIMSDRESPAGHGTGHNVLFVGGNVRFTTTPNAGVNGDNIFLNQASRVAAGLHRLDSVLAAGDTAP